MADTTIEGKTISVSQNEVDEARDSLHCLPLAMIPLSTPGLQRARLVKNARLETAVELYRDEATGSGQFGLDHLDDVFPSYKSELEDDREKLEALSTLNSFDVFSLRIGLRKLELGITDDDFLKLSDDLREELMKQLPEYSRPLLTFIYGECEDEDLHTFTNPLARLTQEATATAKKNVKSLGDLLQRPVSTIPEFVEEYGDLATSLCYFRHIFNQTEDDVSEFKAWLSELRTIPMMKQDDDLMRIHRSAEGTLDYLNKSLKARFGVFDQQFKTFWDDITPETWTALKLLLTSNYSNVGGVLCGLQVKMNLWKERFPGAEGSAQKKVDFLKVEIVPGLSSLFELESSAPKIIH